MLNDELSPLTWTRSRPAAKRSTTTRRDTALLAPTIVTVTRAPLSLARALQPGHFTLQPTDRILITGGERGVVTFANCCLPIPGDSIVGQLRRDQGLLVHTNDCTLAKRQKIKEPDRWIAVKWGTEMNRRFDSRIKLLINNEKGILARVAAEIGESDANITYVGMDEDKEHVLHQLRFTIQVKDRVHLAGLLRNVRRVAGVNRILRERS